MTNVKQKDVTFNKHVVGAEVIIQRRYILVDSMNNRRVINFANDYEEKRKNYINVIAMSTSARQQL